MHIRNDPSFFLTSRTGAPQGNDGDDEEESSEDDEDDDMDIEADEEEEEEHPAPINSVVVAPTATDQAPSVEETEPFETDESATTPPPHPAYCMTARISIPAPVPMPAWTDSEVVRQLAISSPPASPLSLWSLPPHQIPFPPLPPILSPLSPVVLDDLRDALSVLYLTSAHLRSIGIDIPVRVIIYHQYRTYIMSRVGCCGLEHPQWR
nr:hypothetical protein [Tanacetum cinerariifolium]